MRSGKAISRLPLFNSLILRVFLRLFNQVSFDSEVGVRWMIIGALCILLQ